MDQDLKKNLIARITNVLNRCDDKAFIEKLVSQCNQKELESYNNVEVGYVYTIYGGSVGVMSTYNFGDGSKYFLTGSCGNLLLPFADRLMTKNDLIEYLKQHKAKYVGKMIVTVDVTENP